MENFLVRDFDLHMEKVFKNFTINTKYGAMAAATVTPIVFFGGIYIAWAYISRAWKSRTTPKGRVLSRSMSIGVLRGGKLALERLVLHHNARADAKSLEGAERDLKKCIEMDRPPFRNLQLVVAKLEMSGQEGHAVEQLEKALAQNQKNPHEAYEYEMLLVEMYIYKGDCEKALRCKCLEEEKATDARRPLHKAVIHCMLSHREESTRKQKKGLEHHEKSKKYFEHHEKSRKYFEEFNEIRAEFEWPPDLLDSQLYEVIEKFENFEKVVTLLETEIEQAKKMQK